MLSAFLPNFTVNTLLLHLCYPYTGTTEETAPVLPEDESRYPHTAQVEASSLYGLEQETENLQIAEEVGGNTLSFSFFLSFFVYFFVSFFLSFFLNFLFFSFFLSFFLSFFVNLCSICAIRKTIALFTFALSEDSFFLYRCH